jgi:CheY-like chemotaxis protein
MNAECVLFAEDDENDVFFLRRAFREADIAHPLHVVSDGQGIIHYLSGAGKYADRNVYPLPCLVILDLKMPRKTGMEALGWARSQRHLRGLPIMILSSSAHRNDVERAYELGANAFVVKPSSTEQRTKLAVTIKSFWLTFNETPLRCGEVASSLV